ncbi:RNF31 ligase, partial [Polypterus senegalus]
MASINRQRFSELRDSAALSLSAFPGRDIQEALRVMTEVSLPLSEKYQKIDAESVIHINKMVLPGLSTAFNILEKYGRNLMNPNKPKYWRTVKFNNPVFKTTVDAIQGGRDVLRLYGYTQEQKDGLSFPDTVVEPDVASVALVTLEVMMLRLELDLLIKGIHPNPDAFDHLIEQESVQTTPFDKVPISFIIPTPIIMSIEIITIDQRTATYRVVSMLGDSTYLFHSLCYILHGHIRLTLDIRRNILSYVLNEWDRFKVWTDDGTGDNYTTQEHYKSEMLKPFTYASACRCTLCGIDRVSAHCGSCEQWLCLECDERYHMHPSRTGHQRYPVINNMIPPGGFVFGGCVVFKLYSVFVNRCKDNRFHSSKCKKQDMPSTLHSSSKKTPPSRPAASSMSNAFYGQDEADIQRQENMRTEGLKLVTMIREGESRGVSPEEVFAAVQYSGTDKPSDWLASELPLVLDTLSKLAAVEMKDARLSQQESVSFWIEAGGDLEKAVKNSVAARKAKIHEIQTLGFHNEKEIITALQVNGGDVSKAVIELQRHLLAPFHERIWQEDPDFNFHVDHNDRQMQALTSCQCSICNECFQQHFTIVVKEKNIKDMACPVCEKPEINDESELNSYFSTLDIQLRECLNPDVYELFHKKLTERALMKDPKFLWCCHWEDQHQGLSCEDFQSWKRENDPEYQREGLAGYLKENGIRMNIVS